MSISCRVPHPFLVLCAMIAVLGLAGCFDRSVGPGVISGGSESAPIRHDASVRFAVQVDGAAAPTSKLSVRKAGGGTDTFVTFTIQGIRTGTNGQLLASRSQTVEANPDGTAEAAFNDVETVPTIGRVQIEGGSVLGYTDFHGAQDLVSGANVITVNPNGSALTNDLVAHALENAANSSQLLQVAPANLVSSVRTAVGGISRNSATVFDDAVKATVDSLADLSRNVVRLAIATSGASVTATGASTWTKRTTDLFAQGDLWSLPAEEIIFQDVLRQGLDGFGYLACGHLTHFPFAIAKINASTGARTAFVRNRGQCRALFVMPDQSVVVGGTHIDLGCPVLFRWSGSGNAHTFSDADGAAEGLA